MTRRLLGALLVATALAAVAGAAPAPAGADPAGVQLMAQRGFGDPRNSISWSMAWFKGRLYVGTARQEECFENYTVDYYLVVSQRYRTHPLPDVHCPANPYDMSLQAELWQYTPRTKRWRMVYRAPTVPNPRAHGKRISRDIAFRGMTVYRGRLYIGDVTADEVIPELNRHAPPRLLSTADGRHFRSTPASNVITRTPHGVRRPMGVRSMQVWHGRLFVTLSSSLTGDGAVFEVRHPERRHAHFRQVTPRTLAVFELERFAGHLYVGTGDHTTGYGVYKLVARRHGFRVEPIVWGGAGRGPVATSVVSMHAFRGRLYVGASGWYNSEQIPISEMIRIDRHGHWQVVAGSARSWYGTTKAPISGLGDGFYNLFTAHFWRMTTFHGALLVGTNDWSYLVQKAFPGLDPDLVGTIQSALAGEYGFDIWGSCNGADWFPWTRDAFGQANMYDFGARNLVPTSAGLFIGSADHAEGTKVWRARISPCQSLTGGARHAYADGHRSRPKHGRQRPHRRLAAMPRGLLADAQRHGTVVSWQPSAGARGYRVLRASYVTLPLSVAPLPVLPSGFPIEDQLPVLVRPGTRGARQVDVPILNGFQQVGATRSAVFVDRTRRAGTRYAYRVEALSRSGAPSPPSAMQVVPDPRPAPAWWRLHRDIGRLPAGAGRAIASSVERPPAGRRARLALLARLRRSVDPQSDAGLLTERLQRRLRYAGLAGGH